MRGSMRFVAVLAAMALSAAPVSAQDSGLSRVLDRLGRTVDRVMENISDRWEANDGPWSQQADAFDWTGRMESGGTLEIKNINGSIVVERSAGDEIAISARARGRRSDPSTVRVELVEHRDGLTVCAVYPTPENARRENRCAPGDRGQMNTHRNDVQVDFVVFVPAGVPFIGRTVNGALEANDLESDVQLTTVNGDVQVSTTGFAEATTVNGSIDAAMGAIDLRNGLSFKTVNGSIELDLPNDVDADIDAEWLNGGLESDLPIRLVGRMGRHSARGTIGDGGPAIEINTVNGSIRIR